MDRFGLSRLQLVAVGLITVITVTSWIVDYMRRPTNGGA